jgi:hypothetical protein
MVRDRAELMAQDEQLASEIAALRTTVDRIDTTLRGNGTPGLLTRMALMDERVNALTNFAEEVNSFRRWVMMGVLTLLGSLFAQALNLFP